jgi:hypothetical protein
MLKSFSRLNLLSKEYISPFKKGFSQLIRWDTSILRITLPYYDYLRGLVFIDDTKRVYEEETPITFDLAALISLLHDDFIYHTQKGVRNHQQTASFLLHMKENYLSTKQTKTMKRVEGKGNTFAFEIEEEEESVNKEKDVVIIELSMREAKIQRTEVLLYDISPYFQGEWITVEELITILYLDFIHKVKREGNNEKVMKSVLKGLEFYK